MFVGCVSSPPAPGAASGKPASQASAASPIVSSPGSPSTIHPVVSATDWLHLAEANEGLGQLEAAIENLNGAIQAMPDLPSLYIKRGWLKYDRHDYSGAFADFERAIVLKPDYPEAYYGRARVHMFKNMPAPGDHASAIRDFDIAISLQPIYAAAIFDRAFAYYEKKDYDYAEAEFSRSINLGEYRVERAYYYRAEARQRQGEFSAALADITQAIILDSQNDSYYSARGSIFGDLKNTEAALRDFNRALTMARNASNLLSRGTFHYKIREYKKAIADMSESIALDPAAGAYVDRARARMMDGDLPGAITDCEEALRQSPTEAEALRVRYSTRFRQGDHEGALADLNTILMLHPDDVQALVGRGRYLCNMPEKVDAAAADFDRAIALAPKNADAYHGRAITWIRAKQPEKALLLLDRALELDPTLARAYEGKAEAHMAMKQWNAAMTAIDQGAAVAPNYSGFHYARASISYLGFKDYPRTVTECDEFLKMDDWETARKLRERALQKMRDAAQPESAPNTRSN